MLKYQTPSLKKQTENGVWVREDGNSCHKTGKIDKVYDK
jgi:hypothetical protein